MVADEPLWVPISISPGWQPLEKSCPRVSWDDDQETLSILLQNTTLNGDHLIRMETWVNPATNTRTYSVLDDIALDYNLLWDDDYHDVSVGYGYTALVARSYPGSGYSGTVDIFESASYTPGELYGGPGQGMTTPTPTSLSSASCLASSEAGPRALPRPFVQSLQQRPMTDTSDYRWGSASTSHKVHRGPRSKLVVRWYPGSHQHERLQ